MQVQPYIFLLSIFFLAACQATQSDTKPVATIIETLRSEKAPDRRVAIWEVDYAPTGQQVIIKGKTNLPAAKLELASQMDAMGIDWIDSLQVLPNQEVLKGEIHGIVNLSTCNIRSQPKHSGELATQSTLGTVLKIWDKSGDWYRVQTPDGYLGWLDAGGFSPRTTEALQTYLQSERVVYLPDMGFSYSAPDKNSLRTSDLLAGNILVKTGEQGLFTEVNYPDGRIAYIPSEELMNWNNWINSRSATVDNILAEAQLMLGRPYLWGGTSGKAFDCSGFTKTVFYLNGLILPRDASQQIHVGRQLDVENIDDLQAGDLLFFGRSATEKQKERITHVALYLGDHKVIHAAGRVKIESLNPDAPDFAPERLASFVRATRPLEAPSENGIPTIKNSDWY